MRRKLIFFAIITLSGCKHHEYCIPQHSMPQTFTNQQQASSHEPITAWWKDFHDPILDTLIEKAVMNNYDLQIALTRIEASRAYYEIKRAELLPQIGVFGEVNQNRFSKNLIFINPTSPQTITTDLIPIESQTIPFFQLGFDGIWEFDFWGRIWHEKRARLYAFQAEIEMMRDVYIILLADVARTYVTLCSLNIQRKLYEEKLAVQKELLVLQHDLLDAGLRSCIEVAVREQEFASTQNELTFIKTALIQTKNQLAVLLGLNPEDFELKKINTTIPISKRTLELGLPSDLIRRRPDIRQAERNLASAYELVEQAIAEWFPSFSLIGNMFFETNKGSKWFKADSVSWSIGPAVRLPIINFGRIRARVDETKANEREAALRYTKVIINALKDVENFLVNYFNNKEQVSFLENKRNSAIQEHKLINAKFIAGLTKKSDTLTALVNKINTQIELTVLQESVSTNLIALYKALGGGW